MSRRHFDCRIFTLLLCILSGLTSCSSYLTSSFVEPAMGNLRQQTDLDLVCEGAPAYLLMIDSMIASSPDSRNLLLSGTQSYSAYASALSECGKSAKRIAVINEKAYLYGTRLLNQFLPMEKRNGSEFDGALAGLGRDDLPFVFWGTFGWISWVQSQEGSPAAMADLVIIEKIMSRLLELDETFEQGAIHLFFGGYLAAKPALLGGRPELSRAHFEKALSIAERNFLIIQTTYAATLARQTMDKELHDSLLNEVINFPVDSAPEFALSNRIAARKAQRLLQEDYFAE